MGMERDGAGRAVKRLNTVASIQSVLLSPISSVLPPYAGIPPVPRSSCRSTAARHPVHAARFCWEPDFLLPSSPSQGFLSLSFSQETSLSARLVSGPREQTQPPRCSPRGRQCRDRPAALGTTEETAWRVCGDSEHPAFGYQRLRFEHLSPYPSSLSASVPPKWESLLLALPLLVWDRARAHLK